MSDLPKAVHIMEVGPRDGLQIEAKILTIAERKELVEALAEAGLTEIEVGSFVSPKAVPQMADTAALLGTLQRRPGVAYRALWLNSRGLNQAIAAGTVDIEGWIHLAASEAFVKRNTNRDIEETFAQAADWIDLYKAIGVAPDCVSIMAAFGCNFEGEVPVKRVVEMVARSRNLLADHGVNLRKLALADTMGWASPRHVTFLIGTLRSRWPELELKLHLHDTRGLAMANALAALQMGLREFDASIAGLGGCPFAGNKGAAGNICTEDFAFMCLETGIETSVDLDALVSVARLAERLVGHPSAGKLIRGGTLSEYRG
ncbi:hydroxymethylglutaryl-CoA lyase [Silicimonas algicola]|uniref:Hydroxymethylglutaryl-CoA lyase n=1 Tax=Silicimonas algicola TaxID=1826607 RepID=A0A316FYY5_9RHOB|nr:hydroxymethylglutaryl-CoA lyase [Silicimonas algicola]AZQ68328.1 hydroxymethylglutaryl-CoA lyase [Silicimonas algicola]PWK53602.1 hydroxymethylglutaryl-CoA lyase [Silicimonas algicola]